MIHSFNQTYFQFALFIQLKTQDSTLTETLNIRESQAPELHICAVFHY